MTLVDLFFSFKHQLHPFLLKSDGFRHPKGDLAERFTCRVTVFVFSLITAFCVTHFFWGKAQINCWLEHQDINEQWNQFINDYCYVQGTFFIPPNEPLPWKRDFHERIYINYYQWAPYVFAIQGLVFYLPEIIWLKVLCRRFCGVDLSSMTSYIREIWLFSHQDLPKLGKCFQEKISLYFYSCLSLYRAKNKNYPALSLCYLLSKIINIGVSVFSWYWLNHFLQSPIYSYWGFAIVRDLNMGRDWTQTGHFPRLTYCNDLRQRYGIAQGGLVKCALPMMAYYEKIFLFLWFWLGAITIINGCSGIYWLIILCCPSASHNFISTHLIPDMDLEDDNELRAHPLRAICTEDKTRVAKFVDDDLGMDGVLLLRKICSDLGSLPTAYLISQLYAGSAAASKMSSPRLARSAGASIGQVIYSSNKESKLAKTV